MSYAVGADGQLHVVPGSALAKAATLATRAVGALHLAARASAGLGPRSLVASPGPQLGVRLGASVEALHAADGDFDSTTDVERRRFNGDVPPMIAIYSS